MTDDTLAQLDPSSMGSLDSKAQEQEKSSSQTSPKKRNEQFRQRIEATKQYRRKQIPNWISNIDFRRGKPFASQTDEDRIAVNLDWSLTKSKQAMLYSQTPQIRIDHAPQTLSAGPWVLSYEDRVNDTLITAGIETAMDEVMPDVINAAGIGVVIVSHESLSQDVEVPAIDMATLDPQVVQQIKQTSMMPDGSPVPMTVVPTVMDHRYLTSRISPSDFLWPIDFAGSDFDNAQWIGRSGRMAWTVAQKLFNLKDSDKEKVKGGDSKNIQDKLTHDVDKDKNQIEDEVSFDEIFYKEYLFDAETKSYTAIHHVIFVNGIDEPVVDEPWQGQRLDPKTGQASGAQKYPIRVLTLTYITDEAIPPSDSAIGRPQINELNKSRTQMIMQRERSLPLRWFNTDKIDSLIQQHLMRGTWQAMIPIQGTGERAIGEVARASMPNEDFTFDRIAKDDLNEVWQTGPNQQSNFGSGRHSAAEANIVDQNFQTRISRERAKVAKFFVSIAEVLGGLITLYEDPASFGQGFDPAVAKTLSYSILADSTILLDSNQRLHKLMDFINFTAKSGWVNLQPVLQEIAQLSGLDPSAVIQPPQPKPPVEPNISLRLTGIEDLMNPLTLAFLLKSGQAPSPDLIEQAKKLIADSVTPPPGMVPGTPQIGPDGNPLPPGSVAPPPPGGLAVPPGSPPGGLPPGGGPLSAGGPPVPLPAPPGPMEAHPDWGLIPKINKRADQQT